MPTSKRKVGTFLTISPWRTVRRGRDRQLPTRDSREVDAFEGRPTQLESTLQSDQTEQFRSGIAELTKNEQTMLQRFAKGLDHKAGRVRRGVGILAFECSGGNFFGALLDHTLQRVAWYITGEAIESSLQNCGHNEIGWQYYNVHISDHDGAQSKDGLESMAVNSGGDAAKIASVDVDESTANDEVGIVFQCLQLYSNGLENSRFTRYFSHCSAPEDVIINIGIMEVHH